MQRNWLRTNDIDTDPDTWDEDDVERIIRDLLSSDIMYDGDEYDIADLSD